MVDAQHPKLVNVEFEVGTVKSFRKNVGELVTGAHRKKVEEVVLKALANHMTVNVNVFRSFVE